MEGAGSSLFSRTKITTFERYYIKNNKTHNESKNTYFTYREDVEFVERVLEGFGVDPEKDV